MRTHYFVLLNHFRHDIKISFPYYLFTSMSKAISRFKKKPSMNPALHEGLLLLIYEHFKAQNLSKTPQHGSEASKESGSSSFSSDMEDIQSISSEGEEKISSRKKAKELEKKLPSITPNRKSPRGHGPKITS